MGACASDDRFSSQDEAGGSSPLLHSAVYISYTTWLCWSVQHKRRAPCRVRAIRGWSLTRSHQTKASRELKAKATSMSLLDPTYVIEVLPPGPDSERETLLRWASLAAALCGAERSGGTWSRQANVGPKTPTYKREKTSVTNWRGGRAGNTGGVIMPNSEGFSEYWKSS
jgi:hypothetical protein